MRVGEEEKELLEGAGLGLAVSVLEGVACQEQEEAGEGGEERRSLPMTESPARRCINSIPADTDLVETCRVLQTGIAHLYTATDSSTTPPTFLRPPPSNSRSSSATPPASASNAMVRPSSPLTAVYKLTARSHRLAIPAPSPPPRLPRNASPASTLLSQPLQLHQPRSYRPRRGVSSVPPYRTMKRRRWSWSSRREGEVFYWMRSRTRGTGCSSTRTG